MQHIEKVKVLAMRERANTLYGLLDEADRWTQKNLKYEEGETASLRMKHGRRIVRKIHRSLDSKPVFALFGASQVGKSYLVKNLLSIDGAPLQISLDGKLYDFLKEINPPGVGAESTGVVTRFSIDQASPHQGFPVRVKLLDVKDILIILCDGFFSDLKKITQYPSAEQFAAHCQSLEEQFRSAKTCQSIFTEDDILDVQDYFEKHFFKSQHILDQIASSKYWLRICRIIGAIPSSDWPKVFSILWANQSSLTGIFFQLIQELEKVQFVREVYTVKESVLRGYGEILDVQRLKEMQTGTKTIKVCTSEGVEYDLNLSKLSAASAELTLGIPSEVGNSKTFLHKTDLLDFPGARSRLELSMETITEESVPDMFLRGKVAYLFNKYSGDYEINNLLFCQNDKQLDVNEIPSLLHDWISNNIGRTSEEREQSIRALPVSPLFVVFTFFNNQLKFDTTNDDKESIDYKWSNRFTRFFEQEVVTSSFNWHLQWTNQQPIFRNFYMLRDFKYSDDTFAGFLENGMETGVQSNRVDFLEKLKASFLHYPFVQKHFANPEESWAESASPNQDGSKRIIRNLEPAANNYVKMHNYSVQLAENRNKSVARLRKYYHSDNLQEKRVASLKKANELQIELNRVFGKNPLLFSLFMHKIILSESEVYNYFHENLSSARAVESFDEYTLFRSQYPMLKAEYSREKNIGLLREQLFVESDNAVEQFLTDSGIDIDKLFGSKVNTSGSSLVSGLFDKWKQGIQYEKFEELIHAGLTRNAFNQLTETLFTTIENLQLQEFLTGYVEKKTQRLQLVRESEEYLASLCANYINDFVVNVGFNFMSPERLGELQEIAGQYHLSMQTLLDSKSLPEKEDLKDIFNAERPAEVSVMADFASMIGSYNLFLLKVKLAMLSNCGFVNYDVQANGQLSVILEKLDSLHFNLDE